VTSSTTRTSWRFRSRETTAFEKVAHPVCVPMVGVSTSSFIREIERNARTHVAWWFECCVRNFAGAVDTNPPTPNVDTTTQASNVDTTTPTPNVDTNSPTPKIQYECGRKTAMTEPNIEFRPPGRKI
jgi:hypothetical protein